MSEQAHVVKSRSAEEGGQIRLLTVLSNEGLAQTYAAKLRQLNYPGMTYLVEPLVLDEVVSYEVIYVATYQVNLTDRFVSVREADVRVDPAIVQAELPEGSVQTTTSKTTGYSRIFSRAFGWDRAQARARLIELLRVHLDGMGEPWEFVPERQVHA